MKNLTPRQVTLSASGGLSLFLLVLLVILYFVLPGGLSFVLLIAIPVVAFVAGYFLFSVALEKFISGKIEMIYKTLYNLKAPRDTVSGKELMKKDIIGQVEKDMLDWTAQQSEEIKTLKEVSNYRKEFLGNVSHELKTPIFNIQGYLHTLIDGGIDDPGINKRYLEKASDNLERLNNIVQDLEIISQIETNELTLDLVRFNIVDLIKDVVNDLEMKAAPKAITLKLENGIPHTIFVKADRERVRQVLVNLISNSIRYGKQNGTTIVTVFDVNENILIEVSDNGIGIPEQHLPRLFERFYRVDKSRSRELGGTGLGLSIVKHIIEAHGQTITVRSTPGVGSTFGFTLAKYVNGV